MREIQLRDADARLSAVVDEAVRGEPARCPIERADNVRRRGWPTSSRRRRNTAI
jgi:hypothetical protein